MSEFDLHKRRSIRLAGHDYAGAGYYFVTLCVHERQELFGIIVDGKMHLDAPGFFVQEEWIQTGHLRQGVTMDEYAIMPDHFHGIVIIEGNAAPGRRVFGKPDGNSLPAIVRSFKSATSRWINKLRNTPGTPVWQRNYYERIIRNEDELKRTREYIKNNPLKWDVGARRAVPKR